MKALLISFLFFTLPLISYGQGWKIVAKINSGFFHFVGKGANNEDNSYNEYGTKSGLSYGVGIDLKRANNHHIRYGLDIDLESLQSKAPFMFTDLNNVFWEGRTLLRQNFITLSPYLSCNWKVNSVTMNLKSGIEFSFRIGAAKENYRAVSENGETESYRNNKSSTTIDLRPNLQFNALRNRFGLGLGYSYGIWDYKFGWKGGTNLVFSRYLKFSLLYQLNKKPKQ